MCRLVKKHIKGLSTKIKRFWKMKIKTFVKINTPTNKHTHRREESRQTKCRKVSSLQTNAVWVVSVGSEFTTYYCYYYQIQNRIEWAMGRVIYARRGGGIIIIMHFHSELESFVVNVSVLESFSEKRFKNKPRWRWMWSGSGTRLRLGRMKAKQM